ncbi:hypothetical protein BD309DRAFT_959523 [Dichomitus squalens]|uniref:Uncharacterized protein n=1 Tax=Dichomitus squalens TaxID=114155 RepID=A0A4Q9MQ49_9APHY|nr:hypothetical protein BD311DRAFT_758484 [Dichomitus squalens]TBU43930.1 hypothetical protein BD309DRAFT_959523 [Dichomitus squalens]TBU53725.1 hypothetical protein BD310DRAFT_937429 [Dichomitus squalens]
MDSVVRSRDSSQHMEVVAQRSSSPSGGSTTIMAAKPLPEGEGPLQTHHGRNPILALAWSPVDRLVIPLIHTMTHAAATGMRTLEVVWMRSKDAANLVFGDKALDVETWAS